MKTDITAINARSISVNGTLVAGAYTVGGNWTTFDFLDADMVLALNGTPVFGTLPAGAVYTNYDNINLLSGGSVMEALKYGSPSTAATNAGTGPLGPVSGGSIIPPTPAPGRLATAFSVAPDVQYHPHTATMTFQGGAAEFTASVSTSGVMTVTAVASGVLVAGMIIASTTSPEGGRILSLGTGTGGTGTYNVQTVSTAIPSTTFTGNAAPVVASVSDARGNAPLSNTIGQGPVLMTDALGRKFLRFALITTAGQGAGTFMTALGTLLNLDTYNQTWFCACRVHYPVQGALVGVGTNGGTVSLSGAAQLGTSGGNNARPNGPFVSGVTSPVPGSAVPNKNKLLVGTQLQIIGSAVASADGLNGASNTAVTGRYYVNEEVAALSVSGARYRNIPGIEVGRKPVASGSPTVFMTFDLYELVGFVSGQFTPATLAAGADAVRDAMLANFAIPPVTENCVIAGDSRTEQNQFTGLSFATLLTDPGASTALPASTRVINYGYSGQGAKTQFAALNSPTSAYNLPLGGGKDRVVYFYGVNDISGASGWPTTFTAVGTSARANEIYDHGGTLDCAFVGSVSGATLTVESVTSGALRLGMTIAGPGIIPGTILNSGSGTTWALSDNHPSGVASGTALTATYGSDRRNVQEALNRGWKVVQTLEINTAGSATGDAADVLRNRISSDLLNDVQAGPGQANDGKVKIIDLRQITVGGKRVFGADAIYTYGAGWYDGGVHLVDASRPFVVSGGQTPQFGYKANLTL